METILKFLKKSGLNSSDPLFSLFVKGKEAEICPPLLFKGDDKNDSAF